MRHNARAASDDGWLPVEVTCTQATLPASSLLLSPAEAAYLFNFGIRMTRHDGRAYTREMNTGRA